MSKNTQNNTAEEMMSLSRRSCLKLAGGAVTLGGVQSGAAEVAATAVDSGPVGYGEAEYGMGAYGGT